MKFDRFGQARARRIRYEDRMWEKYKHADANIMLNLFPEPGRLQSIADRNMKAELARIRRLRMAGDVRLKLREHVRD